MDSGMAGDMDKPMSRMRHNMTAAQQMLLEQIMQQEQMMLETMPAAARS